MSKAKFTTRAVSTLAANITAGATALSLSTGDGAKFPPLSVAGEYFIMMLEDSSGHYEFVKATARAGDNCTITRAQDGSVARAWTAGDSIKHILNASVLSLFLQALTRETKAWTPGAVANGTTSALEIDVAEAELGDFVLVSYDKDVKDLVLAAAVTAANKVTATLSNVTAAPITPDPGTVTVTVVKK